MKVNFKKKKKKLQGFIFYYIHYSGEITESTFKITTKLR